MAQPFDATTKFLVELNPTDWLHLLGLPLGPTTVAEADMSTVSTSADRLVLVEAATPYALLTEFQGNSDSEFAARLLEYVVLGRNRLQVPVLPVAILLRSFAGHDQLRGRHLLRGPDDSLVIDFRYRVLRVWQMPPEAFLAGGLAVLPLAAIAKVRRAELPRLLEHIGERLEREATPVQADLLRTATFILMGLKFEKAFVEKLMSRNVLELSSTYRALHDDAKAEGLAEGRAEGRAEGQATAIRELILRLGTQRFGEPDASLRAQLEGISSLELLIPISERLLQASTWEELLTPHAS